MYDTELGGIADSQFGCASIQRDLDRMEDLTGGNLKVQKGENDKFYP